MTIYECHGCGLLYDDEEGMPGTCCGKTIRHVYGPLSRDAKGGISD